MKNTLKKPLYFFLLLSLLAAYATGCSSTSNQSNNTEAPGTQNVTEVPVEETVAKEAFEGTVIALSDNGIKVNGESVSTDETSAVYTGADIVYYEEGKDDTYGAGSEADAHTAEEAAQHTVITITQPGTYKVTGTISYGQIAIDLGSDAEKDKEAVVNLVLDNADITCTVAPAIVVYKAYECGSDDTETATKDVDTTAAGFNLILADNSINTVNGSYVAKIYKEGTTDKLHKYDAAIDSKVSFNINGGEAGNGILTVNAENEGISSGLHMTINGGIITVNAGDDSINTSEDNVSVLTVNGGILTCDSGNGSEGDGIDSNGYIVINGGYTIACSNPQSMDSGIDSDLGIYINGGTLLATGNMYDEVSEDSEQTFMVLGFNETKAEDKLILIKDADGNPVSAFNAVNDYTVLVYSSPELAEGDYTLYEVSSVTGDRNGSIYTNITDYTDAVQLQYTSTSMGMGGKMASGNMEMPGDGQVPEGMELPTDGEAPEMPADGQMPEGMELPAEGEAPKMPAGGQMPEGREEPADGEVQEMPVKGQTTDGIGRPQGGRGQQTDSTVEPSTAFSLSRESYMFGGITQVTE
ncbi:MAG: carbohydrate-binding domain-containing protein [Lachnospiraceae bacterium]|nr:carbohydrate-binding domain-containing protein [Lachnospiraceae bacterium]